MFGLDTACSYCSPVYGNQMHPAPIHQPALPSTPHHHCCSVEKVDSHHGLHYLLHERSTLIGRKQEMEALMSVVTAIKEQREHQTGLVAITGSGGTGKTKLLKAFKATALDLGFR